MKRFLARILLPVLMGLLIMGGQTATVAAATACPTGDSAKAQVFQGIGETGSGCDDSGVSNTISTIVTILSYVAGAVAVIMVIVAGFKYVTSGGDSNGIAGAKNTLVYALVGVAVAALAQILVRFVLTAVH